MKNWLKVFFLFFILGLMVFFNSLNNKFLIDDYVLLSNPVMVQTKFISSQWNPYREQSLGVLQSDKFTYYRPLSHIVYDFCYGAFKNNYWKYHLLNLFLFVFACSLIYLLIHTLTGNYKLAFLAGLFCLIHPIDGIVVNYMCSSVFALLLIFMMGAILLLWGSLEIKNNRTLYFLSLLFYFISLFWHEIGIMTPAYIAAVILLFRKDPFRTKIIYLLPYFLIGLFFILFRFFFLNSAHFLNDIAHIHMTGWEYLATLFRLISWQIIHLFYPQGIVMQWATPVIHQHIVWNILGLFFLLILMVLAYARFAKESICRLAIAWIIIGFIPVCSVAFISPHQGALIEPHWFIFSSIGFFILAACFFTFILDRMKMIGLVLLFILTFTWGAMSHAYNQLWTDQKTYALYWSQQVPELKRTYCYLAEAYQREGAFNESIKYYRMALSGHPSDDLDIYNNLGVIAAQHGDWKGAESSFRSVLEINSSYADAYNNLGKIYFNQGQWEKAKEYLERSLILDPFSLEARRNLASIYLKHAEYQKAVNLCLKNLSIVNDDPPTLLLLIDIFIQKKDYVSLKKYAYRALNVEGDAQSLTGLEVLMAQNNAPDIAMDCFKKVMLVDPDDKDAYLVTGELLANLGQYDQAIRIWKLGSSLDPTDQRFKESTAKALKLKLR